jgi:hypothetical protein
MPDKLCPIDKEPCVEDRCAIYCEEFSCCSWAMTGDRTPEKPALTSAERKQITGKDSSKFKAHLFD